MVWVIPIIEDSTDTVKCRTAIKALFLYFNLCLSVMLDSLLCLVNSRHLKQGEMFNQFHTSRKTNSDNQLHVLRNVSMTYCVW